MQINWFWPYSIHFPLYIIYQFEPNLDKIIMNKCLYTCDYSWFKSWFESCNFWYGMMHQWQELQMLPKMVCFVFICFSKRHRQNLSCLGLYRTVVFKHFFVCIEMTGNERTEQLQAIKRIIVFISLRCRGLLPSVQFCEGSPWTG